MTTSRLMQLAAVVPVVSILLGGVGLAWGYLRWAVVYLELGVRRAFKGIFLAFAIASVARAGIVSLPFLARMLLAAVVSVLLFVLVRASSGRAVIEDADDSAYRIERPRDVASFAMLVLLFSAVCSFERVYLRTGPASIWVGAWALVAISAVEGVLLVVLYLFVFHRGRSLGFMQLWGIVAVFLATSILFSGEKTLAYVSYVLASVAADLIVVFLWVGIVDITRHAKWNSLAAFGLGWGLYAVSKLLGKMLAHFYCSLGGGHDTVALLLWVLVIAMLCCMGPRNSLLHRVFSEMDKSSIEPSDYLLIDERCAHMALVFSLTDRETFVMQQICRGRSKTSIARDLGISENTVRGHAKRLYTKLDVHSRDELCRLIGI